MGNPSDSRIILAFESAIRGGSICLLNGQSVLASRHGSGDVSRAEDLLANIAELCDSSEIEKSRIDLVAVSRGPGSYTGIRIGIATAMGLARALDCQCVGIKLLKSMAFSSKCTGTVIAAVTFGRHDAAWQEFFVGEDVIAVGDATVDTLEGFVNRISRRTDIHLVIHMDLYASVREVCPEAAVVEDLAWSVGNAAGHGLGSPDLTPIYIRNPAAAGLF